MIWSSSCIFNVIILYDNEVHSFFNCRVDPTHSGIYTCSPAGIYDQVFQPFIMQNYFTSHPSPFSTPGLSELDHPGAPSIWATSASPTHHDINRSKSQDLHHLAPHGLLLLLLHHQDLLQDLHHLAYHAPPLLLILQPTLSPSLSFLFRLNFAPNDKSVTFSYASNLRPSRCRNLPPYGPTFLFSLRNLLEINCSLYLLVQLVRMGQNWGVVATTVLSQQNIASRQLWHYNLLQLATKLPKVKNDTTFRWVSNIERDDSSTFGADNWCASTKNHLSRKALSVTLSFRTFRFQRCGSKINGLNPGEDLLRLPSPSKVSHRNTWIDLSSEYLNKSKLSKGFKVN